MTNIRKIRRACGVSVVDLAAATNLTTASIYRYEQGKRVPTLTTSAKIAEALGCTVDDLLRKEV
jgi:transcriptional regulator with XRE-family HTH domain